jgi:hypothetical protein
VNPAIGVAGSLRCPPLDGSLCFQGNGYDADISAARSPDSGTGVAQYHSIRYVEQCAGFAAPGSDVCRASVESAQYCAFGAGDTCRACPRGGYCPGGNELRSFPDYYVLSSSRVSSSHVGRYAASGGTCSALKQSVRSVTQVSTDARVNMHPHAHVRCKHVHGTRS